MAVVPWSDREAHRIASAALAHYDLPAGPRTRPVRLFNNAVFAVSTPETRLALRVHRPSWRTAAQVRSELAFLRALGDQLRGTAVTVPTPVPTRTGELVADVEVGPGDVRHCSLLGWLDGQPLRPTGGLGRAGVRLLGEALARIHLAAERFTPPPGFELPRWDADGLFTDASPYLGGAADLRSLRRLARPADLELFEEVADRTRAAFDLLARRGRTVQGLIDNDFILGNCHPTRHGRGWRVGVLDFDDCGHGVFLFDLGAVLGNLADFRPSYPALRRAFLTGYRAVRPLPEPDEALLPLMMAARHASHFLWALGRARSPADLDWTAHHLTLRADLARHCLTLP